MTGKAKIAIVGAQTWVIIGSSNEDFLRGLAKEAKEHGFEAELDLSWHPILKLKHNKVNVEYLKKALKAKGLQVTIL